MQTQTHIQTNNIQLHVTQAGPEDGQLVIFLHGFPEFWWGWRKQIDVLAEAGYREDNLTLEWRVSGHPFLTRRGRLTDAVVHAVSTHCGVEPELSTSGGTSDGRFIAPWSVEGPGPDSPHRVDVVELGPTNATIHKIDERIPTKELVPLTRTYASLIEQLVIAEAPSA